MEMTLHVPIVDNLGNLLLLLLCPEMRDTPILGSCKDFRRSETRVPTPVGRPTRLDTKEGRGIRIRVESLM